MRPSAILLILACSLAPPVAAHDLGLVLLEVEAGGASDRRIVAQLSGAATLEGIDLPQGCELRSEAAQELASGGRRLSWDLACAEGASGAHLILRGVVEGALVRWIGPAGTAEGFREATDGVLVIPLQPQAAGAPASYLRFGFEHILGGWDHLAFVALLCLAASGWRLVKLVTAFTLGHSITLAAATLGLITVPAPPLEAMIAFSIVVLAREVLVGRSEGGSYALVSSFGLLHGLGFASALGEAGFAGTEVFRPLLAFNVGVEIGQLLFVAVVVATLELNRRWSDSIVVPRVMAYGIGILASAWTIERIAGFI